MVSARSMIDMRLAMITFGTGTKEEMAMETAFFWQELAGVIGTVMRQGKPSDFTTFLQLLVVGYALAGTTAQAAMVAPPPAATSTDDLEPTAIRNRRLDARLTQLEVARRVGISQTNMSRWERGRFTPTEAQRRALRHAISNDAWPARPPLEERQ